MRQGVILALLLLLALPVSASERVVDDFESGSLAGWKEEVFVDHTRYTIIPEGEGHCLSAESNASASGFIHEINYDLHEWPRLAWRWRIDGVLEKGDVHSKKSDDYPARIYVVFPHWFPPRTRSINYIWANRLPQGEAIPNSYYSKAIMLAVESGSGKAGQWVAEERNVLEDFRRLFGEEPPPVGAIAIMTDTDNTGERARACYDDIRLLR